MISPSFSLHLMCMVYTHTSLSNYYWQMRTSETRFVDAWRVDKVLFYHSTDVDHDEINLHQELWEY